MCYTKVLRQQTLEFAKMRVYLLSIDCMKLYLNMSIASGTTKQVIAYSPHDFEWIILVTAVLFPTHPVFEMQV